MEAWKFGGFGSLASHSKALRRQTGTSQTCRRCRGSFPLPGSKGQRPMPSQHPSQFPFPHFPFVPVAVEGSPSAHGARCDFHPPCVPRASSVPSVIPPRRPSGTSQTCRRCRGSLPLPGSKGQRPMRGVGQPPHTTKQPIRQIRQNPLCALCGPLVTVVVKPNQSISLR